MSSRELRTPSVIFTNMGDRLYAATEGLYALNDRTNQYAARQSSEESKINPSKGNTTSKVNEVGV